MVQTMAKKGIIYYNSQKWNIFNNSKGIELLIKSFIIDKKRFDGIL